MKNRGNLTKLTKIKDKLALIRQEGLLGIGLFSVLNLAFKLLRNKKVLLLLKKYIKLLKKLDTKKGKLE